jgi:PAS domain S-box-containing protein
MLAPETSSVVDQIHSRLNAISHKLMDLPENLRDPIEGDLQIIRSYVADGALAASATRHRELAESINDGFFELDRDWCFTYVNQRAASNVGRTPDEMIGKNLWETFPQILGTPHEHHYRQVMEQRQPFDFEMPGALTNKWYNIRVYPSTEGITVFWIDINERKQADKALRESEARLRRIAQAGRVGFFEWNAAKDSAYWSPEHYELFGFEPGSPISWQRWEQGVHPDDRERLFANSAWLLERGRSEGQVQGHKDVYRFIREDGSMVWIEADTSVEMVGSEPIVRGVVRDITERKRAEERLLYQANLLGNISDIVYATDNQLRITAWNHAAEEMYGWKEADALGKPILEVVQSKFSPEERARLSRELLEKGSVVAEIEHQSRSGASVFFEAKTMILRDLAGNVTGYVSVNHDITEQKRAAEWLAYQANLLEIVHDAIFAMDGQLKITFWNQAAEQLYGWTANEALGQNAPQLLRSELSDLEREQVIQQAQEMGGVQREITHHSKDGRRLVIEARTAFQKDPSGQVTGILSANRDVTERKQSEELLRYHASLVDNISEAVVSTDAGFRILSWNQGAEKMYGWKADEVIGKPVSLFLRTEYLDQTTSEDATQQLFGQGQWKGEVIQGRKDGTRFFVSASLTLLRDGAGKNTGVIAINHDITERKQAEAKLRENEERLRMALDTARMIAWEYDPATLKVTFSENAEEVLELPRRYENSDQGYGQIHPDDVEHHRTLVEQAIATGGSYVSVYRHPRGEQAIWLEEHGQAVVNQEGKTIRLVGVVQNITERKKAEEALRISEEKFAKAFRSSPVAICISTVADGRFIEVNDSYINLVGFSHEELVGHTSIELGMFADPDERKEIIRQFKETNGFRDYELRMLTKTDQRKDVLFSTERIELAGQQCMLSLVVDITERKRVEEAQREHEVQLETQRRLLEYRDQERQAIARDLHDGPVQDLSGLLFNIQFTKEVVPDPSIQLELEKIAAGLRTSVQNLREMINVMRPPSLIRFGLAKALNVFLEDYRERHPEMEFNTSLMDDGNCLSEPVRLGMFRILQEALNNIIKHANAGRVDVTLYCEEHQIVLEIHDDGEGFSISENLLDYSSRGHFGLIGMKERADAARGKIQVTSTPGEGTTIKVIVPTNNQ